MKTTNYLKKAMNCSILVNPCGSLLGLLMACSILTACSASVTSPADVHIANPASVACVKSGGTLSIKRDSTGAEFGWCSWSSGTQCEEWSYFRGECAAKKPDDFLK